MNTINESESITPKQKGDSLEMAIEHIFNVAGFTTERQVFIANYEIDVKAEIGDRTIIIECKNYQNSSLTIRNLIHQWNSKNQIIRAHKIIIALAGMNIKDSDYTLANELNIELWSQDDISELFNLSLKPNDLREKLIEKVSFKPLTINERYRDNITYLIIKPLLSSSVLLDEELFYNFNRWLRAFILTELQIDDTSPEERANLIELFEGNKTKKSFFNLIKKNRTEVEYWDRVKDQLESNVILSKERQNKYLSYMDALLSEYDYQSTFFDNNSLYDQSHKLISTRLYNALILGQNCKFKTSSMQNSVSIDFVDENTINITVSNLTIVEGNIFDWVMTSQSYKSEESNDNRYNYTWICSSLNETSEKVYRIFTEYYQISSDIKLRDLEID